jgi:hypothetical protein
MKFRDWDVEADRLAHDAASAGAPTRWFEELWSARPDGPRTWVGVFRRDRG